MPRPTIKREKRKPIDIKPKLGTLEARKAATEKYPAVTIGPEIEKSSFSPWKIAMAIAVLLIIIIIILVWPKTTDCNYDKDCFIEKADLCKSAVLRDTIGDDTIIKYSTNNCILKKEFESFSETEPEEVVDFFKNKEMTCEYEKQDFNPLWIEGISIGVDDCEGDLKDAIIELRLAQLEIT